MKNFLNVIKPFVRGGKCIILFILLSLITNVNVFGYTDLDVVLQVRDVSPSATNINYTFGYNCLYGVCNQNYTYEDLLPPPNGLSFGYRYAGSVEYSPIWEDCNSIAFRLSNLIDLQLGPTRVSSQTGTNDDPNDFYWILDVKNDQGNHIQGSPFGFDDYYTFEHFYIGSLTAGKYSAELTRCYSFPTCSTEHYKNAKVEFEVRSRSFTNSLHVTSIDNCDDENGIEVCVDFDEATGFVEKIVDWGDGNSEPISSENTEICHIYENEGIYTITVDYEYYYCDDETVTVKSASKQVAVGTPLVSITSGATVVCAGVSNLVTLTANVTPNETGITYAWSNSSNTQSTQVAPTESTNYSVTVTYPVSGCTAIATTNIDVVPDCCEPLSTSLAFSCNSVSRTVNPTYGSVTMSQIFSDLCVTGNTLTFGQSPSNALEISINGVLTIDGNYIVVSGMFKMGTGAAIAVNPNVDVSFNYCQFYGCDEMWQGFVANSPSSTLSFNHSRIEDAIVGVDLSGRAVLNALSSTIFMNNRIGIAINDFSGNTQMYQGDISNCRFESNGQMKPPFANQRTSTGILVMGMRNWSIPNNSDPLVSNYFEGINNGIFINTAGVEIRKNIFEKVNPYQPSTATQGNMLGNNPHHGNAIYILDYQGNNHSVHIQPSNDIPNETSQFHIKDCHTGIMANGANVVIENLKIEDTQRGIRLMNCRAKALQVNNCFISGAKQGIALLHNPATNADIFENEIRLTSDFSTFGFGLYNNTYGIEVEGNLHSLTAISSNRILNGRTGIRLSSVNENTFVQGNLVSLPNFSQVGIQAGILAENSEGLLIIENSIFGGGGVYGVEKKQTGIELKRTGDYQLRCNVAAQIGYGIAFKGDCSTQNDYITENKMLNNRYGWRFERITYDVGKVGNSVGSNSFITKNIFVPPFNNPQGFKTYNYTYSGASYRPLYYYASGQQLFPDLNGSNVIDLELETELSNQQTPTLSDECTGATTGIIEAELDSVSYLAEEMIAEGSVYYPEFGDVLEWIEKQELFKDLHTRNEMILNSAILYAFYTNMQNSGFAQIYDYEQAMKLLTDSAVFGDSLAFAETMTEILDYANNLPDENPWEQNLNLVAALYNDFLTHGPDSLHPSDLQDLRDLAYSCPYVEGTAVWQARSLLSLYADTVLFNDKEICQMFGMYKTDETWEEFEEEALMPQPQKLHFNYKATLFPNPASKFTKVMYTFDKDEGGMAYISDASGRFVGQLALPANHGAAQLGISQLQSGVYNCKVTSQKGFSSNIRFVVTK